MPLPVTFELTTATSMMCYFLLPSLDIVTYQLLCWFESRWSLAVQKLLVQTVPWRMIL